MNKYIVNFKKLALMFLPPAFRKPWITAILYSALNPLNDIYVRFKSFRRDTNYRLTHNGQTCYLEALLNDMFDRSDRRIYITEDVSELEDSTLHMRSKKQALHIPLRKSGKAHTINRRGFGGINGYDFWVCVPAALRSQIDVARLTAIVNTYKLASKRFSINFV